MRTIVLANSKAGTGKSTLAASLAVAAAAAGDKVIALDLDPQGSLANWGETRGAWCAANDLVVDHVDGACPRRARSARLHGSDSRYRRDRQHWRQPRDASRRTLPGTGTADAG